MTLEAWQSECEVLKPLEILHNLACALYIEAHPDQFPKAQNIGNRITYLSARVLAFSDNDLLLGMELLSGKVGYDRATRKWTRKYTEIR